MDSIPHVCLLEETSCEKMWYYGRLEAMFGWNCLEGSVGSAGPGGCRQFLSFVSSSPVRAAQFEQVLICSEPFDHCLVPITLLLLQASGPLTPSVPMGGISQEMTKYSCARTRAH